MSSRQCLRLTMSAAVHRHRGFSTTSSTSLSVPLLQKVKLSYTEYKNLSNIEKPSLSPVLMTHGLLGSKQNWNSIAKAISKLTNRRVVTFDARNHGESPHVDVMTYDAMVEDVVGLVEDLKIDKFVLLGHSMGGRTACSLGLIYPDLISGLVIVDISPINIGGDFDKMKLYLETLKSISFDPSVSLSEARKIADVKLRPVVLAAEVRAFLLTNLTKTEDSTSVEWKPNLAVLLQNLNELKIFPQNLLKSSCNSPALFMKGQKSAYLPNTDFNRIRNLFPKAEFVTIEKAGHWPQADAPAEFIQKLVSFLQKIG